jgi:hypothetical protein
MILAASTSRVAVYSKGGVPFLELPLNDKGEVIGEIPKQTDPVHFSPRFWTGDGKTRTRLTLVRSIIWYCEHYKDDVAKTIVLADGKPALELSFRIALPINSPDGEPYFFCGHIDKLASYGESNLVLERKHTVQQLGEYYFAYFNPNSQVSGYTMAGRVTSHIDLSGFIIDAIQVGATFTRCARHISNRTKAQLDEWLQDTLFWIKQAERYATYNGLDGPGYWPKNEESCGQFGGCQYRGICSKDPSVRENFLAANFIKRPWNPLKEKVAGEI